MSDVIDTQVIVVGAGPVGLMLAAELRLGGANVVVLEQRIERSTESRASTLHARTMEILDSRGLVDRLGSPPNEQRGHFAGIPLDLRQPSPFSGQWKVPQTRTEEVLETRAIELGADIRRGWRVGAVAEHGEVIEAWAHTRAGTRRVRAAYLVACDGEDSTIRNLRGVDFPGTPATKQLLRADVEGIDIPNRRFERFPGGLAIAARNTEGVTRVMVHEFGSQPVPGTPDFATLTAAWHRVTGEDISAGIPLWINSFGDANRLVRGYQDGRVLYAGDAAHQQMPAGGQALNLGLQDAVNLGWKLALRVRRRAPESLLASYHTERHAVGERILANIHAQAKLLLGGPEVEPVRDVLRELFGSERNHAHLAGMISGLDVRYPCGESEDPLLGARLPVMTLSTPDGQVSSTALLASGRGLLLDRGDGRFARAAGPWSDRVNSVVVHGETRLGAARALLVRPDGYVAWTGSDLDGAVDALHRWFGAAHTGVRRRSERSELAWTRT